MFMLLVVMRNTLHIRPRLVLSVNVLAFVYITRKTFYSAGQLSYNIQLAENLSSLHCTFINNRKKILLSDTPRKLAGLKLCYVDSSGSDGPQFGLNPITKRNSLNLLSVVQHRKYHYSAKI